MEKRFRMHQTQRDAYKALLGIEAYIENADLNKNHLALIKLRASQLNGCTFCLHMHLQEALQEGEDINKLMLLTAWKDSGTWFSQEEKTILALTEALTLIHEHGVNDREYNDCITLFGEEYTAQLFIAIAAINTWNRIGRGLNMQPGENIKHL